MNRETNKTNIQTSIYFEEILKGKKNNKNDENLINKKKMNNNYNCNLSILMYYYIISNVEFDEITDIIISIKLKNRYPSIKKNTKNSKKHLHTLRIKSIPPLETDNSDEKFLVTKTKRTFVNNIDWMYSPINLLSIQRVILRSIQNYYDRKRYLSTMNHSTKKMPLSNYYEKKNEPKIERKQSFANKLSLNMPSFKKNLHKMSYCNDFSLLNQKRFFRRPKRAKKLKLDLNNNKIKEKDKAENAPLSDFSSDGLLSSGMENSDSNDLEDIYYHLLNFIIESKNKLFIKLFEEKKQLIDINQQLIEGNTLLILSAREGNHAIAKFLCEQGTDVNIQNNSGNTALHYAIGNQFYSIADILTRFGAREDIANSKGLLPWDCNENN
jgi:hypothetical protein